MKEFPVKTSSFFNSPTFSPILSPKRASQFYQSSQKFYSETEFGGLLSFISFLVNVFIAFQIWVSNM